MREFKKWMDSHRQKNLKGFFSIGERELTDREVRLAVNYAVRKGSKYDSDIPVEELERLFNENVIVQEQTMLF